MNIIVKHHQFPESALHINRLGNQPYHVVSGA